MIRTIENKLYLSDAQEKTLANWLGKCCWFYNQMLAQRIGAYRRRGESINYNKQQKMLTEWRGRIESLRLVPTQFARDALRRVDRGMQAFFRSAKSGNRRPGFPRFRPARRYNSLEQLAPGSYTAEGAVRVPGIGLVRARGRSIPPGIQKGIRIIRRASGWFAQVLIEDGMLVPEKRAVLASVGVDVGLSSFATMSDGSKIANPRWLSRSAKKLRALQRRVSRRRKGSTRRKRAAKMLAKQHERISAQRRNFCHKHSTDLVGRYDLIGIEKLNVSGMSRSRLGKSILDAAWSTFTKQLAFKAESAGCRVVEVNARGTSQECPNCGAIKPKKLSERIHECKTCGLRCDRDHAAARVILARARNVHSDETSVEGSASTPSLVATAQVGPVKRKDSRIALRRVK